ncbi:DNA repair exonuclease SbcCD ATPase subunit [Deinococcus metalli]|uniref:DNA repair exonuclease SbcCD ATPase subunit n=1 Tax=Deinococcus metalli TaxID=1141878 RepID=A0A7W8KH05_9DEIO|nr:hypothetical protein [Deinococcus metalli]MBB5378026.1 DNA repair exonuclease SbcCD ATPase subunit [Deinococcus metalli]GHF53856.1 hypothetical protein GCM10017781_32670 [Deinococcus metalli]
MIWSSAPIYTARMPDRPDHDDLEAAERYSALSARSHVGAAGFAQTQALEAIISAGRDQIALTHALRQVIVTTQAQLRSMAPPAGDANVQEQTAALEGVVRSGQTQIEAADELRRVIQAALNDVRGTPVEDISVTVLTDLGGEVHRQAQALNDLLEAAISEAASPEQVTTLERVGAEASLQMDAVEHRRAERELAHLDDLKNQVLSRIRQLEAGGETHAEQKVQLEEETGRAQGRVTKLEAAQVEDLAQIATLERTERTAMARVAELEAAQVQNLAEIAGLEEGVRTSAARVAALEAAAVTHRDRIKALRDKLNKQDSSQAPS